MLLPDSLHVLYFVVAVGFIAELVAIFVTKFEVRKYATVVATFTYMFSAGLLIASKPLPATILIGIGLFYRALNILRLFEMRWPEPFLTRSVRRTAAAILTFQILAVLGWLGWRQISGVSLVSVERAAIAVDIFFGVLALTLTLLNIKRSKAMGFPSSGKIPTVSVLIPARNETSDLESCLASVVASKYQKLEIIALDDCSRDKTPELIRGFAHDGVRFIKGKSPNKKWLAKNQAYERLAEEATGEILLFMGVDVRLSEKSIKQAVRYMTSKNLSMLSIMPTRSGSFLPGIFIQPMRYYWQLALPRWQFGRPPVLSTCWLITKKAYQDLGGMAGVEHSVLPESSFARRLAMTKSYGFIRSDDAIGISTVKRTRDQIATAIRTRYPELHKRVERTMLLSIFEAGVMLAPFWVLVTRIFVHLDNWVVAGAVVAAIAFMASHKAVTYFTDRRAVIIGAFDFPVVVLIEIILLNLSMFRYEFGEVNWKGRNICLPMLQTIKKLPDIK